LSRRWRRPWRRALTRANARLREIAAHFAAVPSSIRKARDNPAGAVQALDLQRRRSSVRP
jgi:hypothetical protein